MVDNLNSMSFQLTDHELHTLSDAPQVWCSIDPQFYECAPDK
jgi:hypothetical protein